eukprot:2668773-Amphidinium_carterae.3
MGNKCFCSDSDAWPPPCVSQVYCLSCSHSMLEPPSESDGVPLGQGKRSEEFSIEASVIADQAIMAERHSTCNLGCQRIGCSAPSHELVPP